MPRHVLQNPHPHVKLQRCCLSASRVARREPALSASGLTRSTFGLHNFLNGVVIYLRRSLVAQLLNESVYVRGGVRCRHIQPAQLTTLVALRASFEGSEAVRTDESPLSRRRRWCSTLAAQATLCFVVLRMACSCNSTAPYCGRGSVSHFHAGDFFWCVCFRSHAQVSMRTVDRQIECAHLTSAE